MILNLYNIWYVLLSLYMYVSSRTVVNSITELIVFVLTNSRKEKRKQKKKENKKQKKERKNEIHFNFIEN